MFLNEMSFLGTPVYPPVSFQWDSTAMTFQISYIHRNVSMFDCISQLLRLSQSGGSSGGSIHSAAGFCSPSLSSSSGTRVA